MEPGLQAGKKLKGTNPQRRQTERGSKCSIFVFLAFEASTSTTQALITERAEARSMTQRWNESSEIWNIARRLSDKACAPAPNAAAPATQHETPNERSHPRLAVEQSIQRRQVPERSRIHDFRITGRFPLGHSTKAPARARCGCRRRRPGARRLLCRRFG